MCSPLIEERWASIPLEGVPMERMNLPFFYQLGMYLHPLTELKPDTKNIFRVAIASLWASSSVRTLLERFPALSVCRTVGNELLVLHDEVTKWLDNTPNDKLTELYPSMDGVFQVLIEKAKEFETVVSAELPKLDTFQVTQKGIYDTTDLIEKAEKSLPAPILNKINEAIAREIRESGKCLAFDCATASGFHIIRAIVR